jgi:hypothetical protein
MKSVKLSLATIVAAGALTSVASATPLEQAIKDVDVSGFAWIRYDSKQVKVGDDVASSNGFWKFKTQVNFKFAIDDNFYALLGLRYENRDHSYGNERGGVVAFNKRNNEKDGAHDDTLDVNQYALGYKIGNTDILVGRQIVGSFLTADMAGTGIKIVNKDIQGLTIVGAAFDALEDDVDIGSTAWGKIADGKFLYQHNLYTVQVSGSYNPVDFTVWWAQLAHVANLYGADLAAFFDINDKFGLGAHGQFAGVALNGGFKESTNDTAANTTYWALKADMKLFGLTADAGFLQYGKKDAMSLVSLEDNGKLIKPGENLIDTTAFVGRHSYWFITAKYDFLEKYWVGADFVSGQTKYEEHKSNDFEVVGRAGYKYNKKLSFWAWYSYSQEKLKDVDNADDLKTKTNQFRFQATYKF